MHGRIPASRYGEAVHLEPLLPAGRGDRDLLEAKPPRRRDHAPAGDDRRVKRHTSIRTAVDHSGNLNARRHQIARRLMRAVVVAIDSHTLARCHAPTIEIGPHCARIHDAGAVVVRECDRPLQRASRKDRPPSHDPPEALARQMPARRLMQTNPLERAVGALIIGPRHSGARHQAHVLHTRQLGQSLGRPDMPRLAVDLFALGQQTPAHPAVFIGKDHIHPRPRRCQRRHQARWPRTNHQKIAEGIGPLIAIFVVFARQGPDPRRATDKRLVELFPKSAGPHEGLVVKARAKERRGKIVDRQHIKAKARPAVLAFHLKALVDLDHRRPNVRLRRRARSGRHQRVRLLTARRQDAARAVIFERPRHKADVVGQ